MCFIKNNARFGFTFQKAICDYFKLIPSSNEAIRQFNAAYDKKVGREIIPLIEKIFTELNLTPTECVTFMSSKSNEGPYNFVLSGNSTLSIRTNINGSKVAPREVGQAGFPKLNEYFGNIYGKEIVDQNDIKKMITGQISDVLPIFFEHLFDADYILWVSYQNEKYNYDLIKGDVGVDIEYKNENFSFTRNYDEWVESTTLKYKGTSIAEIQVHKERSFKFRFIMKNVMPLIVSKNINNETLGITAERAVCNMFNLPTPKSFLNRYSVEMDAKIRPTLEVAFEKLPPAIKHTGDEKGKRGGASKCSYDFILKGDKTLSLKTNTGKMVCPPEVGQPTASTFYLYFNHLTPENYVDEIIFKKMVLENVDKMLPIYINHMFSSDYLLWVYKKNDSFDYMILDSNYAKDIEWDKTKLSFTRDTLEMWNESTTLKYDGISIGEFQYHKNRDCYKFRFNLENFIKVVEGEFQNDSKV